MRRPGPARRPLRSPARPRAPCIPSPHSQTTEGLMARVLEPPPAKPSGARPLHKVPDPYPLTLAGLVAALGPQAINFGISIGGGEAYLLPNISARGTLGMHWLMLVSVVL